MFADLHIHTNYSDGTMDPSEVVSKAKAAGLGAISICDHNTVAAYQKLNQLCSENGIKLINGVEIDSEFAGFGQHILAYGFDLNNEELLELLDYNRDIMERLSIDLIGKMSAEYPVLSPEEYEAFERNPQNGGWKGIDYLRSKGHLADFPDCMKYYKEYSIQSYRPFPSVKMVCTIIHNAGGVAVLAHPGARIDNERDIFLETIAKLKEAGIDGLECYYPSHSDKLTELCLNFCAKNNMVITAGSDCHGEFAKIVDGITYEIGAVMVDTNRLNLKGLIDDTGGAL